MRQFFFIFSLLLSLNANSDPGQEWLISANSVNMRAGPSIGFKVITRLDKAQAVVELQRQGEWLEVGVHNSGGLIGWVHESLLKTSL